MNEWPVCLEVETSVSLQLVPSSFNSKFHTSFELICAEISAFNTVFMSEKIHRHICVTSIFKHCRIFIQVTGSLTLLSCTYVSAISSLSKQYFLVANITVYFSNYILGYHGDTRYVYDRICLEYFANV